MNDKNIKKLLSNLDRAKTETERNEIIEELDNLKKSLNKRSTRKLYPDQKATDFEDFTKRIMTKQEFIINQKLKDDFLEDATTETSQDPYRTNYFNLYPHQLFLKKYISPQTNYRTIYLYHGVGVGKTCASIQIAENFRNYFPEKKPVLVLSSSSDETKNIFIKELVDFANIKETRKCMGDYYINQLNVKYGDKWDANKDVIENEIKRFISGTLTREGDYKFLGFRAFVNHINKLDRNSPNFKIFLRKVKDVYDNRIIIIDEAHNMRFDKKTSKNEDADEKGANEDEDAEETSSNRFKKFITTFHYILQYLDNTRLILLSATPMFNKSVEIIDIFNTILIHEKIDKTLVKPSNDSLLLTTTKKLNPKYENLFKNIASKYISYIRGEDPIHFPTRIYPSIFNDKNVLTKSQYPKYKIEKGKRLKIDIEDHLKYTELIKTSMSSYQNRIYERAISNINLSDDIEEDEGDEIDDNIELEDKIIKSKSNEKNKSSSKKQDLTMLIQISNIVFPPQNGETAENTNIKNLYGRIGLKQCFNAPTKNKLALYEYKPAILREHGEFLNYENIGKYSPKIKQITDYIKTSTGIIIVFSRFFNSIIATALALEHQGMNRYGGTNLSKGFSKTSRLRGMGDYIILAKENEYALSTKQMFAINEKTVIDPSNRHGEQIKVILITVSSAEGKDFKNIREIHIMEPWYHLNRNEQIIGRGVRTKSHYKLEKPYRNTTIFQYVNLTKDNKIESIDYRNYRIAEKKQFEISLVERLIKEHSVDCTLHNELLVFRDDPRLIRDHIVVSQNNRVLKNFDIGDKDYTRICDYDKCNIKCAIKIDTNKRDFTSFDNNVITDDIKILRNFIKEYFKSHIRATYDTLFKEFRLRDMHRDLLYNTLLVMIKDKNNNIFTNNRGQDGYLIYRGNKFIFQPIDIKDEKITLKERERKNKVMIVNRLDMKNTPDYKSYESTITSDPSRFDSADIYLDKNIAKELSKMSNIDKEAQEVNYLLNNHFKNFLDLGYINDPAKYKIYEKQIWDIVLDNLPTPVLYKVERMILRDYSKITSSIYAHIKRSFDSLGLIIYNNSADNPIAIYNHYNNHFRYLDTQTLKLLKCNTTDNTVYMNRMKKFNKRIYENIHINTPTIRGYRAIVYKKETHFKIRDITKLTNKSLPGSICFQNSAFNNDTLIKDYILPLLPPDHENIIQYKKKYKKKNLCQLYEMLIKYHEDLLAKTRIPVIYYMRPQIIRIFNKD